MTILAENQILKIKPSVNNSVLFILESNLGEHGIITVEFRAKGKITEQLIHDKLISLKKLTKTVSFGLVYGMGTPKLLEVITHDNSVH